MRNLLCVIFLFYSLSGFAENEHPPAGGAIEFMQKIIKGTTRGFDSMFDDSKQIVTNDVIAYQNWWCPRSDSINGHSDVIKEMEKYCSSRGGILTNGLCRDNSNKYHVYFIAVIGTPKDKSCSTASRSTEVGIMEPTSLGVMNDRFISIMKSKYRYRTLEEDHDFEQKLIASQSAAKERERIIKEQQDEMLRRHNEALAADKDIGDRVCRDIGIKFLKRSRKTRHDYNYGKGIIYGYVENINQKNNKLQIRLNTWTAENAVMAYDVEQRVFNDIDFEFSQNSLIWDSKEKWYACG